MLLTANQLFPQFTATELLSDSAAASMPAADCLVGQQRACKALAQANQIAGRYSHSFAVMAPGSRQHDLLQAVHQRYPWQYSQAFDWLYLANPLDNERPLAVNVKAGQAQQVVAQLYDYLSQDLSNRAALREQLLTEQNSSRLEAYLSLLDERQLTDIGSDELATIVVSQQQHQALYICDRVTESQLFGSIRLQSQAGTVHSDLRLIEPGMLLKANGQVLAINAHELLQDAGLWQRLKYYLKTAEFTWDDIVDAQQRAFYQPQAMPLRLKVVLFGERDSYALLREHDRDFEQLFPILADFSGHYSLTQQPLKDYLGYLRYVEQQANCLPLAAAGYDLLIRQASRWCEHQQELSLDSYRFIQWLREADAIARQQQQREIERQHLQQALIQQQQRQDFVAELSRRAILEEQVHIATASAVVGQLNGLTVVTLGGSEFGEPSRITATVHYGDGDIIDIERKAELSGNIHTKGVMILSSYLANLFARNEPMSLSATVVFEQSYHEVDGDSASLAELCCLLSALAEAPLRQELAVTGAIDQFGAVQAIGAVNEKIEGYFRLCQARGLSGTQGVIIPQANAIHLNLDDAIVAAVTAKQFHIHTVSHVTEAVSLLTDLPCGDANEANSATLFGRVQQRLSHLHHNQPLTSWWQRLFMSSND